MEVRLAGLHDVGRWDKFVLSNRGSVFHSWAWGDVLEHSFRYKRLYLLAEESSQVAGVFPLFFLKNIFLGKRLSSLPVSDLGGPLGGEKAVAELIESAQQLLLDSRAEYIEVKGFLSQPDYFPGKKFHTFLLDLPDSEEKLLEVVGKKNRNLLRKSEKMGVHVSEVKNPSEVDSFYDAYTRTMKQLGTPPYPKSFYEGIRSILAAEGGARLLVARRGGDVVGAAVFLFLGETAYYLTGVSPMQYRDFAANTILLYDGMSYAVKQGYKKFDFGRTSNEGVFNFKKSWGGTPTELTYYYKSLNPDKKFSQGGRAESLSPLWSRLVPLPVTKLIGPPIRGAFGF